MPEKRVIFDARKDAMYICAKDVTIFLIDIKNSVSLEFITCHRCNENIYKIHIPSL